MKKHIVIFILLFAISAFPYNVKAETVCYNDHNGLASMRIGGGVQDRYGLLWFATWNGLHCYDGYDFHRIRIQAGDGAPVNTAHIRDIMLSPEGNIWCHTDEDVYEFNLESFSFKEISPSKKASVKAKMGRNWCGMTDRQGNRWTADRQGLYKTFTRHYPAKILNGTENMCPRALLVDKSGRLWVGLRADNRLKVYAKDGTVQRNIPLPIAPYCIYEARNGDIWVGGKPGALFKIGSESISNDEIYDIKEDRKGRLWVATWGEGIKCCENPEAEKPVLTRSLGGRKVKKLLITPYNNIVAASVDGLLIGHINDKNFLNTKLRLVRRDGAKEESISNDALISVAQNSKGDIYIATESSGIDIINERELFSSHPRFRHLNERNSALTSDLCNAMTLYNDTLLGIVGNNSVTFFNTLTKRCVNYSMSFWCDSCRFLETSPVCLDDDTWVLGSEQGALMASRHSMYSRGYIPALLFTTLSINGGNEMFTLVPRKSLLLKAEQRDVTIHFAAIDYRNNKEILYRTRLDGSLWTAATDNRSITLFNLTPGCHVLEVQSTDGYGRWVDNVKRLEIEVSPFWYETVWAKIAFLIMAIFCIGGIIYAYIYIKNVNKQRRELLDKLTSLINEKQEKLVLNDEDNALSIKGNNPEDTVFLNRVRKYIEENLSNPDANINDMAAAAAASRSTLNRHLKRLLGISATQLLIKARMKRAKELIEKQGETGYSVTSIATMCGYSDVHYFRRVVKTKLNVSL